jgi:hypothetical protein
MLVSRPGAVVRTKPGAVFGQNFGVMPIPFVFPQAIEGLGYMDHVRETRTGVNNSFQGLDAGQLTQLQPGTVNQISSMAAQRTEQAARHMANGVTTLVSLMHELVLKSGHKKEVVQLRGQWVTVDPSTWRKRTDFRISVGFAAGNKDAQITRLMMIGNMQKEAMAGGLSIVSEENVYETMNELIKAADMQAPQRFLTHPSKAPPKGPPQPDVTVMAMEQIKSQTALETKRMDVEQKERDSVRDFEIKKAELAVSAQTEQMKLEGQMQLEDKKAQTTVGIEQLKGQQARELEGQRSKTTMQVAKAKGLPIEGFEDDAVTKEEAEEIKQSIGQIQEAVTQLSEVVRVAFNSKRRIRRGKNGKAEGVDILDDEGNVLAQQSIVRGPDGKAEGTQ